ncbi:MAG: peroxidase family protein [Acidimicrobiales bacterium]
MQPNDQSSDTQSGDSRSPAEDPNQRPTSTGLPKPGRRVWSALLAIPIVAAGVGSAGFGEFGLKSAPAAAASSSDISDDDLAQAVLDDRRSLDGSENNLDDPSLGQVGQIYPRVSEANYADDIGEMMEGPAERYLSNRIFNDTNQNIFSENGVTHWGFVWGQFLDHTIGLREVGDEELTIAFDPDDPLEDFTNDLGGIATTRSAVAEGTGIDGVPREQTNIVSSFIDAWAIYGGSAERLDWLRDGVVDGDPTNNEATLLNNDGYLPTAAERDGVEAPPTDLMGRLYANPGAAVIAGDVRVNENLGLTAAHTLFLREHNRIVGLLPDDLDEEAKFEIARRVVAAQQQYITYSEFLPAMGVELDDYSGYDSTVDPSISSEFATVGYRAHSQIHGEFEAEIPLDQLDDASIEALENQGITVEVDQTAGVAEIAIPLNVAFGNPALLQDVGLGNLLAGLTSEAAYANDGQIDNQLRSVLFQIPGPDTENPLDCLDGEAIAECFSGVNDLGALDVIRAYDHGMPSYNELRIAYGLNPVMSFAELTGEATEDLGGLTIDDPTILDFVHLEDGDGNVLEIGSDEADAETVVAERRTTAAARLAAIFVDVDTVDAFTGMVSEPHVPGTEFGELQLAMWQTQFKALRDGDRYFYENDPLLDDIAETYGIDYQRSLSEVIADNTDIKIADLPANAFLLPEAGESGGAAEPGQAPRSQRNPSDAEDDRRDRNRRQRPDPRPDVRDNDNDNDNDGRRRSNAAADNN